MVYTLGRHVAVPQMGRQVFAARGTAAAAANWWEVSGVTCVAAYQPKGAASLAASYSNLANPGTNDAATGTAPGWNDVDGWQFDGATTYLKTGIVPDSDQSQAILVQYTNASFNAGRNFCGCYVAWNRGFYLAMHESSGQKWRTSNGQTLTSTTAFATAANIGISGNVQYVDGVAEPGTMGGPGGDANGMEMYIGAYNITDEPQGLGAFYCQAFAFYASALSAGQMATVAAAMAAL